MEDMSGSAVHSSTLSATEAGDKQHALATTEEEVSEDADEAEFAAQADVPSQPAKRCAGTVGDWCGKFQLQQPLPPKVMPPHPNDATSRYGAEMWVAACQNAAGRQMLTVLTALLRVQAPPHGDKTCKADCNGVGVCQADFGYCMCPAGTAFAHQVLAAARLIAVHNMKPQPPPWRLSKKKHACRVEWGGLPDAATAALHQQVAQRRVGSTGRAIESV